MERFLPISTFFKFLAKIQDLIILNLLAVIFYFTYTDFIYNPEFEEAAIAYWIIGNTTYVLSLLCIHIVLYNRIVRPEDIVSRVGKTMLVHILLFLVTLNIIHLPEPRFYLMAGFFIPAFCFICMGRLFFRKKLKLIRKSGKDSRTAIVVGTGENMREIIRLMQDPWNGYRLAGAFCDDNKRLTSLNINRLGKVEEVISWLSVHRVDEVYCGLSSSRSANILPLINYCENNLIRLYIVPSYRNYLKRKMTPEQFGDALVLAIRREPLGQLKNRIMKRSFDLLCSTLFLCTLYPLLYVIIGIAIKISSPGPVYFKQDRTGLDGKTFKCLKFRSMKVNKDCDKLQATQNDPRKTKLGDFLRHSNLDELPQVINVWKGNMSLVGPRPHMLQHTETYSQLINKYMLRHLVKPGITGWAQINGFRGETKRLEDMKNRVRLDIWYLENWTFGLDIYIIYKTIINMINGEKNAY